MQQSSESIGAIAAALARAQSNLTNPEKAHTAVIHSPSLGRRAEYFDTPHYQAVSKLYAKL